VPVDYGAHSPLLAEVFLDTYLPRSDAATFVPEATDCGPELPNDLLLGLHRVGDTFLKTPEDVVPLVPPRRHAMRGELDIILDFDFDEDPLPAVLAERLRDTAYEILALLNIHLRDFLVPAMPFQIRKLTDDGHADVKFIRTIAVQDRVELGVDLLALSMGDIASFLYGSINSAKFRTALELYAAHFNERQMRVRFLLLVIAMEALADESPKDQPALGLVERWIAELNEEKAKHGKSSGGYRSLDSLGGQLNSLRSKSIGAQIGDLFAEVPGLTEAGLADMKKRAKAVYNKRSKLVHDGYVPPAELPDLEKEARTLVETLFRAAIARSERPPGLKTVRSKS
ncbi:hypothetical protein MRAB57_1496, partial [Mycobacterium rhizamassiliense]